MHMHCIDSQCHGVMDRDMSLQRTRAREREGAEIKSGKRNVEEDNTSPDTNMY